MTAYALSKIIASLRNLPFNSYTTLHPRTAYDQAALEAQLALEVGGPLQQFESEGVCWISLDIGSLHITVFPAHKR